MSKVIVMKVRKKKYILPEDKQWQNVTQTRVLHEVSISLQGLPSK